MTTGRINQVTDRHNNKVDKSACVERHTTHDESPKSQSQKHTSEFRQLAG